MESGDRGTPSHRRNERPDRYRLVNETAECLQQGRAMFTFTFLFTDLRSQLSGGLAASLSSKHEQVHSLFILHSDYNRSACLSTPSTIEGSSSG